MKTKTTTATIRLSRQRILYDIANNAFVVGETMGDADAHGRHLVQDLVEGQNIDRVDRVVALAFCRVRNMLRHFIVEKNGDIPFPTPPVPECVVEYSITLVVPGGLPRPTLDYWAVLIDEYVTASAISDWLETTAPQKAATWRGKMEEAERKLLESIATCRCRKRKRMEVV